MISNTGSTETVVKYVVYRLLAIAAILFYWIMMKDGPVRWTGLLDRSAIGHAVEVIHHYVIRSFDIIMTVCIRSVQEYEMFMWVCSGINSVTLINNL